MDWLTESVTLPFWHIILLEIGTVAGYEFLGWLRTSIVGKRRRRHFY